MRTKFKFSQAGQTLLEITVMLGVLVVILGALAITTLSGLRNSQFSKNQALATKFAQEGLEQARTIRDRNYAVCLNGDTTTCHYWSDLWNINLGTTDPTTGGCNTSCLFQLQINASSCPLPNSTTSPFCLKYSTTPESLSSNIFTRQVVIEDYATNQKKVTSVVRWSDSSGSHKSELTTVLVKF